MAKKNGRGRKYTCLPQVLKCLITVFKVEGEGRFWEKVLVLSPSPLEIEVQ